MRGSAGTIRAWVSSTFARGHGAVGSLMLTDTSIM